MGWFYCFLDVVAQDTDGTPYSFSVEQEPATGFIAKYTDGETVSYTLKKDSLILLMLIIKIILKEQYFGIKEKDYQNKLW